MENTDAVEYRDVPGFPGYRVGDDGSVWSCWRLKGCGKGRGGRAVMSHMHWRKLKPKVLRSGHLLATLRPGMQYRLVHRLVLEAFVGPCPKGRECCHNDGNPGNNNLSNLRWDTHRANMGDRSRHGTQPCRKGERNGAAKLTRRDVESIRIAYDTNMTFSGRVPRGSWKMTALEFHCSETLVRKIAKGEVWKLVA